MSAHRPRRGPHPRTAVRPAAALVAAIAAVWLDRARVARRAASVTTT